MAMALDPPPKPPRARGALGALLLSLICSGCVLLADRMIGGDPSPEPTPTPARTPRPPSRWRMRFCDLQIQVKRALIIIDRTERRLEQSGSAFWFEEVGDDLADLAERAREFMEVVPDWRPARPLMRAERSMLWQATVAGRLIEAIGEAGRSEPRSPRVRSAMRIVRQRIVTMERSITRAEARGIPCARPEIPTVEEIIGG